MGYCVVERVARISSVFVQLIAGFKFELNSPKKFISTAIFSKAASL